MVTARVTQWTALHDAAIARVEITEADIKLYCFAMNGDFD